MTIADGLRKPSPRRTNWRWLFHALVFLSLIGLHVRAGPYHTADGAWYIDYALSIHHEQQLPRGPVTVVPLYPLWLTTLIRIDPDYRDYLQCVSDNFSYQASKRRDDAGLDRSDRYVCEHLDDVGIYIRVLLAATSIGLVWLAGWLVSGRPMVAHLGALFALYAGRSLHMTNSDMPESLIIPLFAGVNVCLAWMVLMLIRSPYREEGDGRTKLRTAAVAITCGLLLGTLALVRPPYEFLLAALPIAAVVWVLRDRRRRRAVAAATVWILISASLIVTPWLVRNYMEKDFVGFTQTYGPHILMERLDYNGMTWRQWIAAFPNWVGLGGGRLVKNWFGKDTRVWLRKGDPESRERRIRGEHMLMNVAAEDQLGVVLRRVWAELPKHLAVSVPLAWRGMNQTRGDIPYGNLCWLLVILGFALGTHRNRCVLAALAFCPFVIVGINALVSYGIPRYGIGLLTPLSVGVALSIAGVVEDAWSGMRRPWAQAPAPRGGPRNGSPP